MNVMGGRTKKDGKRIVQRGGKENPDITHILFETETRNTERNIGHAVELRRQE